MDNKINGIVKAVSMSNGGILLITKDNTHGIWWNSVGDKAKNLIKEDLKDKEIELTIVNKEKHTFSYLKVLNGNVKRNEIKSNGETIRLRSMALSYSKDLAVARIIEVKEIESYASSFLKYIMDY